MLKTNRGIKFINGGNNTSDIWLMVLIIYFSEGEVRNENSDEKPFDTINRLNNIFLKISGSGFCNNLDFREK